MHVIFNNKITSLLSLINKNGFDSYLTGSCLISMITNGSYPSCCEIVTTAPLNILTDILNKAEYNIRLCHDLLLAEKDNNSFFMSTVNNLDNYFENTAFTINALVSDITGHIIERYSALNDIKSGIIRCVNNPKESLGTNKLNKLKAVRQFSELNNFAIDNEIIIYIKNNPDLDGIDKRLISTEINLLLTGPNVKEALMLLKITSLLKLIFPHLEECAGIAQHEFHTKDVFGHTLDVVGNTDAELILRLSALFHDVCKPECKVNDNGKIRFYGHDIKSAQLCADILKSLGYENDLIKKVFLMIKYHMKKNKLSDEELLKIIDDCAKADLDIDYIFALQFADNAATLVTDKSGMYYNLQRAKQLI